MNNKYESNGIKSRLISGVQWKILEAIIVSASNFASAVVSARLLGLDDFGAFSIIRSTAYMMASVAGLGLGITATKYIAAMRNSDTSRLGVILGMCSVVASGTSFCFAGGLLLFATQIANYNLNAPQIADQLRIAACYILFFTMNGYQVGVLTGFESFAKLARISLIQSVAALIITYIFTLFWGLTGASLALGLTAFCNWLFHHLAITDQLAQYGITICYKEIWKEKTILVEFTFPAALAGIIGAVVIWSCNAALVRQADGLAQMAIFTAAGNFRSFILFVPGLVTRVATPILCNLVGEKNNSSYSRLFWFNIAFSAGASTIVAGVLVVVAPYLLTLFGKGFTGGESVVLVVSLMSVIEVIANTFYQPLFAHGKLWWQVRIIICWSLVLAVLTFTSVGEYGALGLAYAYLAAHIVSATMYIFITFQIEKSAKQTAKGEGYGQHSSE